MNGNLLVTMSGGTTTVINATLSGIIDSVQKRKGIERVYAGRPGIIGALKEELVDLTKLSNSRLKRLRSTPASGFIGTTRVRPLQNSELKRLEAVCDAHDIRHFINIGGNGTIKQSVQIAEHMGASLGVAALPKTVDNDLGDSDFVKVYFTPGFPSCANYWKHKLMLYNQENLGACSHDKVLIAQTFGRKTGFLTACARLADRDRKWPLILLLPEDQRKIDAVMAKIDATVSRQGRALVVVTEGYEIDRFATPKDPSGQIMYGSSQSTAGQELVNKCMQMGMQARATIPGFDQRCDISYSLGHDIDAAFRLGVLAVDRLSTGNTRFLVSIGIDPASRAVRETMIPFSEIDDYSRRMPVDWLRIGEYDVSDAFLEYAERLVDDQRYLVQSPAEFDKFIATPHPNVAPKLRPWSNHDDGTD